MRAGGPRGRRIIVAAVVSACLVAFALVIIARPRGAGDRDGASAGRRGGAARISAWHEAGEGPAASRGSEEAAPRMMAPHVSPPVLAAKDREEAARDAIEGPARAARGEGSEPSEERTGREDPRQAPDVVIAAFDVSGDARPDLIVFEKEEDRVSQVLLSREDGDFEEATSDVEVPAWLTRFLALADEEGREEGPVAVRTDEGEEREVVLIGAADGMRTTAPRGAGRPRKAGARTVGQTVGVRGGVGTGGR